MSALPLCPNCQAPHDPSEAICWMCRHKFWAAPNAPKAIVEPPPPEPAPAEPPPPLEPPSHEPKRGPYTRMPDPEPSWRFPSSGPAPTPKVERDGWTQPLLIVAFILVLMGLVAGPQKGTALIWLGIAPAFFVTALAGFRQPKQAPDGFLAKFQYVLTKIASVIAIMILVVIAIMLALAAACAAIIAGFGALGSHH